MKTVAVLTILLSGFLNANNCPEPKVLADELMRAQLDGLKINFRHVSCLKPEKYQHIRVDKVRDPAAEAPTCLFAESDQYEITKVKKIDHMTYSAEYTLKLEKPCQGRTKIKDAFSFVVFHGPMKKRERSCATIIGEPENIVVREPCAKKIN